MTKTIQQLLILCTTLLFACAALADDNAAIKEVQAAYYSWCNAIATAKGHPQEVVKFYAPDAILLPTLSPEVLFNRDGGLNEYFIKLTSSPNIHCVPKKLITRMYGEIGVNAGLYDFTYLENGKMKILPSRFTFIYEKYAGQWLIVTHHSSLKP